MRLPPPLQDYAEALVRGFLFPDGAGPDFLAPPGEPALTPPDSVSWMIFKNPATLFAGGVAAVLLELAEPRVRAGVWTHSRFRTDPLGRIRRTGLAALVTVYGARSQAEALIARVGRMHATVSGATESGEPYAATDPELLTWVQATALYGFAEAWSGLVRPLTQEERDRLCTEGQAAAALYGAPQAPRSWAELESLLDRMRPRLERSDVVFEFLSLLGRARLLPAGARPAQTALIKSAVALLPADIRATLGLGGRFMPSAAERALARTAAFVADRLAIDANPAVQACRRLGLPGDWLYETRRRTAA
jgi:uncharacterized protein (DUF2236 family)